MKMIHWQSATILVLLLFISLSFSSVILTDTTTPSSCNTNDQSCLISRRQNIGIERQRDSNVDNNSRKITDQERSNSDRSFRKNTERSNSDLFLVNTNKDSRRLHDRVRDVKRSVLDHKRREISDSRRLRNDRRYLADERYTDSSSSETKDSEKITRPENIRERLLHKFSVADPEDGYDTTRIQRRFSLFRDEINNAKKVLTRFERLRKYRMRYLTPDSEEYDGERIISRFERNRQLSKLAKDGSNLESKSEVDRLLPRHFQNFRKFRESLDRTESAFDRRNAYATQIRNKIRLSSDDVKEEPMEPTRFEIQRKHRQELREKLEKENIEGSTNEESEAFLENRRMRKEQRRVIEEKRLQEEKQRILEEEKEQKERIHEEKQRIKDREQSIIEAERKVQEILQILREKERQANEKHETNDEEKQIRLPTLLHEDDKHIYSYGKDKMYDREQRFKDYEDWLYRQYDLQDYDYPRQIFDEDEYDWDYSDYSDFDSSESFEDDELNYQRRLREDIKRFPDIRKQIRDNIQMYGKEHLNAKDLFSEETKDNERKENTRKSVKHEITKDKSQIHNENSQQNNRRKRSIDESNKYITTNRRFRRSSELKANKENRQIAEERSFRSQDERHNRRMNLRQMNANRQITVKNQQKFIKGSDLRQTRLQQNENRREIHNLNRRTQSVRLDHFKRNEGNFQNDRLNLIRQQNLNREQSVNFPLQNEELNMQLRVRQNADSRNDKIYDERINLRSDHRVENFRNSRIEDRKISPQRNRQIVDFRGRTNELRIFKNFRQQNNEINLATRKSDYHQEDIKKFKQNRLESFMQRHQNSVRNDERSQLIKNQAIENFRKQSEKENRHNYEINSISQSYLSKHNVLFTPKQFENLNSANVLQAFLLGIIILKVFMHAGITAEKKERSKDIFQKLRTVFHSVKVF